MKADKVEALCIVVAIFLYNLNLSYILSSIEPKCRAFYLQQSFFIRAPKGEYCTTLFWYCLDIFAPVRC